MYSFKITIHENFTRAVQNNNLPTPKENFLLSGSGLSKADFLSLFESQMTSRHLDLQARELKIKGNSFYTIGSSGHEGNAAFGFVFPYTDMAFLHYRSGAFFVQRSKQREEIDAISDILFSLVASKSDPISGGRHKVLGSKILNIPPQTSTIASHLPKALGAALSITRAKELKIEGTLKPTSLILTNFGDASYNHASCQTTLNAADWITYNNYPLPLLFVCEDNGIGISSPTPAGWIEASMKGRSGIKYFQANGLNLLETIKQARLAEAYVRKKRKPAFLHMKCVRLLGHAGSDIETQYLTAKNISKTEEKDPLLYTARISLENNIQTKEEILNLYHQIEKNIFFKTRKALASSKLKGKADVMESLFLKKTKSLEKSALNKEEQKKLSAITSSKREQPRNMSQSINLALFDLMETYKNIILLGEDIGKKGGVYHVTSGLQKTFTQRRVLDTLLDETTIIGTAIGLAHNNFLPIPEIQFLAYLHNAEDQIRGEACTLSFFSNSQFSNPMVLRLPSLAYQKGFGGHFHNDNSLAVLRDIPSLIIVCPSNAKDAAALLRESIELAWSKGCVVAFIEPIALYMTKDLHEEGDQKWLSTYKKESNKISQGEIHVSGENKEITLISYANGYYLARKAQKILEEQHQIEIKVIDLRWLKPLPVKALLKELCSSKHILIIDECRKTGSLSEELMCELYESGQVSGKISRITGEDSFIPLGDAAYFVLPSLDDIIKGVKQLVFDLKL